MSQSKPLNQSRLTTLLVDNLHCPSCVATVKESLGALRPAPFSVSTSIVLQEVKVLHPITLSDSRIVRALEDAGFTVDSMSPSDGDPEAQSRPLKSTDRQRNDISDVHLQSEKHIRQCEACSKHLATLSTEKELEVLSSSETMSSVMDDRVTGFKYRVSLAISGMSCSSCVGKITTALQGRPWILSLDVNLLTSSALVVVLDRAHVDTVLETIRESGYKVEVVDIEEIRPPRPAVAHRSESIKDIWRASYVVEGMSCSSCVGKVTDSLHQYDWITRVDVNLVAASATVEYQGKNHMDDIAEIIGGLGYKATLSDIESRDTSEQPTAEREIHFQIDGMHCDKCPQRVIDALTTCT